MGKTFKDTPLFKETMRRLDKGRKHVFTKHMPDIKVQLILENPTDNELALTRAKLVGDV